jgi:hypothetical protein
VRGMERFVCRDDPPPRKRGDDWDPDVNERPTYSSAKFDKAFRSLCKKSDKSISDMLLREKKGGILHFESMVYRPGKPEFAGENYNVYRPSPITIAEAATDEARADLKFWNDHLTYLFPNDAESRDHVLNYLAWRIQHPGEKMKHAMILQGRCKGTGKSFVGRVIAEILGASNIAYPRETDLSNKFNAWAAAAQFIIIEELRAVEKRKIKANLHPMISEERLPVEYKGVDTKQFVVCFGILAYTNEDAALSIDKGDRRYLVVRSEAIPRDKPEFGSGFDVGYYTKLFDILKRPDSIGAIAWELKNRDLGSYNAAASAPMTKAKKEMTDLGGTPVEQWMIENHDKWPLCARLTTIEEIRQIMPKHLIDRYVDQNIAEALIGGAFAGARIRVPVNTIKTRLWSINNEVEVNRLIAECDAASRKADKITVANRNAALAAIYEADKVAAGKGQPVIGDGDED